MKIPEHTPARQIARLLWLPAMLCVAGCGGGTAPTAAETSPTPWQEAASTKERVTAPEVPPADVASVVAGNTAFATELYGTARSAEGNLLCSPYSISLALAMVYAGAQGNTAAQMAQTLHFDLPDARVHPAFNALDQSLREGSSRQRRARSQGFRLNIANALWGQRGDTFVPAFLDTLAENYGAGLKLLDFKTQPEPSREILNQWVSEETQGKIGSLFPRGSINSLTRLVLANAIYFKGAWQHPFQKSATADRPFTRLDGSQVTAPFMAETEFFGYATAAEYDAVELRYEGGQYAMVVVAPKSGKFGAFEAALTPQRLAEVTSALRPRNLALKLPKFTFSTRLALTQRLRSLGMTDAFSPGVADLSGMNGARDLFISDVLHKAFIDVNEEGTEAAAATGVVIGVTSVPPPPVPVTLDRPFLFYIRHLKTDSILFLGRVLDPTAE